MTMTPHLLEITCAKRPPPPPPPLPLPPGPPGPPGPSPTPPPTRRPLQPPLPPPAWPPLLFFSKEALYDWSGQVRSYWKFNVLFQLNFKPRLLYSRTSDSAKLCAWHLRSSEFE